MVMQKQKKQTSGGIKIAIILLAVLLILSLAGLAARYLYLGFFSLRQETVTVPGNLIGSQGSSQTAVSVPFFSEDGRSETAFFSAFDQQTPSVLPLTNHTQSSQNQAQAAGISDLSLQLSAIPADCGSCENDLCIVIGNLLENAVRASKEASDPFIQLNCRFEQGLLSLSMTNSYASVSRAGDGTFLTTRDGGGIGLLSIRFIAERYGGSCRFEAENGSFYSLVYMNIDHLSPDGTGILDDTKAAAPTGTM